jgi:hypothetical protein
MKYTANQIIERALNLADIANTDFLTHREQLQYLNDAWQTVYQWLINKGDKQFVKEVYLENAAASSDWTEYLIPADLYQIKSLKNRITGDLILRQSESESINSGKYEIVNDRIRLYGNTNCPLLLTYWTTPTFITFPDKKIDFEPSAAIVDSCLDSILLSDGNIINCVTGETLAAVSLPSEEDNCKLGNGYYLYYTEDDAWVVKDFNGVVLNTINTTNDIIFLKNKKGYIYYQVLEDSKYSAPKSVIGNYEVFTNDDFETAGYPQFIANIDNYWISYNATDKRLEVFDEDATETFSIPLDYNPNKIQITDDFNGNPAFYVTSSNNKVYFYTFNANADADYNIEYDQLLLRPDHIYATLKYGILTLDGLYSIMPDTELNFPNDLYFSLLACDLALRYCTKMNSNTDGLSNLYANMQTTFMNTLSQDSGYTRIRNVY